MAERLRFHLDEHVDPAIARALRRHGIDVTTTVETGLRGSDDAAHHAFVRAEQRVIVTHDPDFLRLAAGDAEHPGVAFCEQRARSIGQIISMLILMWEVLAPQEMRGRVQFL